MQHASQHAHTIHTPAADGERMLSTSPSSQPSPASISCNLCTPKQVGCCNSVSNKPHAPHHLPCSAYPNRTSLITMWCRLKEIANFYCTTSA